MSRSLSTGVVTSAVGMIRQWSRDGLTAWHRFWFEPADPLLLGVLRLLTGWMLFYTLCVWTLDLEAFFGNTGLQPLESVRRLHEPQFVFSFWIWMGDTYLWPMHIACLIVSGMFCLGFMTRVTSILSFLITISYSQRVPIANFGLDQILGMLCLYLSLAPSGAACSLDSLLRDWRQRRCRHGLPREVRKSAAVRMSMRLIQLHLCSIYFWAGHAKLKGPTWWTGDALWRVIANQEYQTLDLTWMAQVPWLPYLIAHLTIVWEVFFVVLVWSPRLRPLMLLAGVAMHLGIGAFLGMWTFGLIMIFAYLAFLDPDVWRARWNRISRDPGRNIESLPQARRTSSVSGEALEELANRNESGTQRQETISRWERTQTPSKGTVCIVATGSADRSALRRYFRDHGYDCRAVADPEAGLLLLSRQRFTAVLVNGTKIPSAGLIEFAADVADLTRLPIILLLTPRQLLLAAEIRQIAGATWLALPASLQEIRLGLEAADALSAGDAENRELPGDF